jgi:hypothetical protein
MSERSRQSGRGRWLIAEFIVVVLGVVVGLAADEWRTQAGDQDRREIYLAQLGTELGGSAGRARAMMLRAETTKRFGAMVRDDFASSGSHATPDDSLATALTHLATQSRVTFVQSTYQDLLATGSSALFDPELRRRLNSVYDSQRRWEEHSLTFPSALLEKLRRVVPFELQEQVTSRDCSLEGRDCAFDAQLLASVVESIQVLRDDPDFLGALNEYLWWTDRSGRNAQGLREQILETVALIAAILQAPDDAL